MPEMIFPFISIRDSITAEVTINTVTPELEKLTADFIFNKVRGSAPAHLSVTFGAAIQTSAVWKTWVSQSTECNCLRELEINIIITELNMGISFSWIGVKFLMQKIVYKKKWYIYHRSVPCYPFHIHLCRYTLLVYIADCFLHTRLLHCMNVRSESLVLQSIGFSFIMVFLFVIDGVTYLVGS